MLPQVAKLATETCTESAATSWDSVKEIALRMTGERSGPSSDEPAQANEVAEYLEASPEEEVAMIQASVAEQDARAALAY